MNFILLINVKMPTIVGILTFISMINTTSKRLKARNFFICRYFSVYIRNEFNFWNVHGIMNTSGLVQSKLSPKGFTLTLQETRSIHDSMNIEFPKIEFITYIYILYYQSSIKFQFSHNLAGFTDILN